MIAKMSPVSQLFLDVMQSATAQDWMWLLKFDVLRNLVRGATRDTFGAMALRVYHGVQKIYPNGWAWFSETHPLRGRVSNQSGDRCTEESVSRYSTTLVGPTVSEAFSDLALAVVPTDKDGGYAIFECNMHVVHEKTSSSGAYTFTVCRGVGWATLKRYHGLQCKAVDKACGELGHSERQLLRSTQKPESRITCRAVL